MLPLVRLSTSILFDSAEQGQDTPRTNSLQLETHEKFTVGDGRPFYSWRETDSLQVETDGHYRWGRINSLQLGTVGQITEGRMESSQKEGWTNLSKDGWTNLHRNEWTNLQQDLALQKFCARHCCHSTWSGISNTAQNIHLFYIRYLCPLPLLL